MAHDMTARNFSHLAPPLRLHVGPASLAALPLELQRVGSTRPFVVCAPSITRHAVAMDAVHAALQGFRTTFWSEVEAHSPVASVRRAAMAMAQGGADAVIALGGGSAIVTARAANIMRSERGDILALCTRREHGKFISPRLNATKLPQFVIPSTPTTAMAKAGSAMLDEAERRRAVVFDPKTRATAIFVHPAVVATAPASLMLSSALNALSMAVEGLESRRSNPLADGQLLQAVDLLVDALPALEPSPDDPGVRERLMLAAILCAQGTDHAGSGLASVLAHAIGAHSGLTNGLLNTIMLPHTMRFNAAAPDARSLKAVRALCGRDEGADAADAMHAFLRRLTAPSRLRDLGVAREDLADLVTRAKGDWFLSQAPRQANDRDLQTLLEAAW